MGTLKEKATRFLKQGFIKSEKSGPSSLANQGQEVFLDGMNLG